MTCGDDSFDEELCEELSLEFVDQQQPAKPKTKVAKSGERDGTLFQSSYRLSQKAT